MVKTENCLEYRAITKARKLSRNVGEGFVGYYDIMGDLVALSNNRELRSKYGLKNNFEVDKWITRQTECAVIADFTELKDWYCFVKDRSEWEKGIANVRIKYRESRDAAVLKNRNKPPQKKKSFPIEERDQLIEKNSNLHQHIMRLKKQVIQLGGTVASNRADDLSTTKTVPGGMIYQVDPTKKTLTPLVQQAGDKEKIQKLEATIARLRAALNEAVEDNHKKDLLIAELREKLKKKS